MSEELLETGKAELVETSSTILSKEAVSAALNTLNKVEEAKEGVKLDADYHEFKVEGETVKGVFMGYGMARFKPTEFDPKNPVYDTQETVKWISKSKDGKVESKICASVSLVNKFKQNNVPMGSPVQITFTGKNGNVKLFEVTLLSI